MRESERDGERERIENNDGSDRDGRESSEIEGER